MVPLSSLGPMADGNMENISPTIPINISRNPGKIENVPMLRFKSIPSCSKNFVMYFLGHTMKFQVSTLALLNMRLKIIPMLILFNNACVW